MAEIIKYNDTTININVNLEEETVWLNQSQMSELFNKNVRTISEHINNTYNEVELTKDSTTRKFRTVQKEGTRTVERNIDHYNLDVIISVGYRVKSKRGTQFRIWATQILKNYILKNYFIDKKKLTEQGQTIKLLESVIENRELPSDEAVGLIKVLIDFNYALDLLDQYDHQQVATPTNTHKESYILTYKEGINLITELKNKFGGSDLFGNEKDESFIIICPLRHNCFSISQQPVIELPHSGCIEMTKSDNILILKINKTH